MGTSRVPGRKKQTSIDYPSMHFISRILGETENLHFEIEIESVFLLK